MMNGTHNETSRQALDARQRHDRFLVSLERHGGNATRRTWSDMASELDWTVEEVQTYAYRYMMALKADQSVHEDQDNEENESTNGDAWSLEENILFESLLAMYLPDDADSRTYGFDLDWEEQVAAQLPGRTPIQVRRKYNACYMKETGGNESTNNLMVRKQDGESTRGEAKQETSAIGPSVGAVMDFNAGQSTHGETMQENGGNKSTSDAVALNERRPVLKRGAHTRHKRPLCGCSDDA